MKATSYKVGQTYNNETNGLQMTVTGSHRAGTHRGAKTIWHVSITDTNGMTTEMEKDSEQLKRIFWGEKRSYVGQTTGTRVTLTEEERIEAKARLKFKDATKGLEAMEAAGLLSGKALANAKKELEAKIKAEQERLTAEAVAEKVKKEEEAKAKKAKKLAASKVGKVCELLDTFTASELKTLLKAYIGTREDAKAIMEVVTKAQELDDARNEELGQMYGFNA